MNQTAIVDWLFALQLFQVLFLALHDWIPLGRLNDLTAVQNTNSFGDLVSTTLVSTLPFAFGLFESGRYLAQAYPHWLLIWLWASYGLLFLGELQAWWIPYLLVPQPARAARYEKMFGNTHAFLPTRNGIQPNTLHIILHVVTLATLILLAILTFG